MKEAQQMHNDLLNALLPIISRTVAYNYLYRSHGACDEMNMGRGIVCSHVETFSAPLCVAHTWVRSTSGSVRSGLNAEISTGGVCPRIMAARLSATAGACITPCPLKPQDAHTPGRAVSPTSGC